MISDGSVLSFDVFLVLDVFVGVVYSVGGVIVMLISVLTLLISVLALVISVYVMVKSK